MEGQERAVGCHAEEGYRDEVGKRAAVGCVREPYFRRVKGIVRDSLIFLGLL